MSQFNKKQLTSKSENISGWYLDLIQKAKLADYSEVKGTMIIRPNGYALWESFVQVLDQMFKDGGVKNAYFPLLIPYHLLKLEKEHVEGFSPELALVTHAGGEELSEPLVVRPTSETIINESLSRWIKSHRDLPIKLNQWCNVMRWEKRTFPFMRTTEFLWQEGHTAHQTSDEAQEMVITALNWYQKFYQDYLSIAVYTGIKSQNERFAGAKDTYGVEIVMPDGKALQGATSHHLADHFAKVFNIAYSNEKGELVHPQQTSWGLSTRSIGGLIYTHGDDDGLIIPPKIAPIQVVIVAIAKEPEDMKKVETEANKLAAELKSAGVRVEIDANLNQTLGFRINEWELLGIPLRLEIGLKEVESKQIRMARRDTFEKDDVAQEKVISRVIELLEDIQQSLLNRSTKMRDEMTVEVTDFNEFKRIMSNDRKFVRMMWCEDPDCESKIKEETKAVTRVLELEQIENHEDSVCVHCQKKATRKWLFAQSY